MLLEWHLYPCVAPITLATLYTITYSLCRLKVHLPSSPHPLLVLKVCFCAFCFVRIYSYVHGVPPPLVGQKSAPQKSIQHNQATPKRVMSPLKRFNRVAPSSGKATPLERRTLELKTEQDDTPLKSSSASRLEKNAESLAKSGKDRPDSAPLRGESVSKQVPIDVRVIIKSNEQQDTQSLAAEGECMSCWPSISLFFSLKMCI